MPELPPSELIELAIRRGFISEAQGAALSEEVSMFPGTNPSMIMVRRQMISPEQMQKLQVEVARVINQGPPVEDDEIDVLPEPVRPVISTPPPVQKPKTGSANFPGFGLAKPAASSALAPQKEAKPLHAPAQPPRTSITAAAQGELRVVSTNATLEEYLVAAREGGSSDVHFVSGRKPFVRRQGRLVYWNHPELTPNECERLLFSILCEPQREQALAGKQLEFAHEIPGVGRYRCSIYRQRLGWDGAFRIISNEVLTLQQLEFPPVLQRLTEFHQGLIMVTGPTGSGKTTTVAAMLQHVNQNRDDHLITVEDPIEIVLTPARCQVTQRQVGEHTMSFANALRGALRQDPDVIMVGEMRDLETTSIAISASETGHLVFGTLHTSSTLRTVARILEMYPSNQRAQIALMVAESTRGILSQQLVPRRDRNGRACAMEILLFTTGVAQIIKEGKTHQLVSHMQSGKRLGMITMDDSLMDLFQRKIISGAEAFNRAENKPAFESIRQQV